MSDKQGHSEWLEAVRRAVTIEHNLSQVVATIHSLILLGVTANISQVVHKIKSPREAAATEALLSKHIPRFSLQREIDSICGFLDHKKIDTRRLRALLEMARGFPKIDAHFKMRQRRKLPLDKESDRLFLQVLPVFDRHGVLRQLAERFATQPLRQILGGVRLPIYEFSSLMGLCDHCDAPLPKILTDLMAERFVTDFKEEQRVLYELHPGCVWHLCTTVPDFWPMVQRRAPNAVRDGVNQTADEFARGIQDILHKLSRSLACLVVAFVL